MYLDGWPTERAGGRASQHIAQIRRPGSLGAYAASARISAIRSALPSKPMPGSGGSVT